MFYCSIIFLLSAFGGLSSAFAQGTWTQKADFGGTERFHAVGFSIDSKGYIGTGGYSGTTFKDFWEYAPDSNMWTQKADFGGTKRTGAAGFSIGSKGYIGTGVTWPTTYHKDFWEYDPSANTWTQKADFGGTARFGAAGFSIGSKGYIGAGVTWPTTYHKDFWEFDPLGGFSVSITASTNVSCYGGTDGSATASASGGTSPYTYSWNTTPVQTTATATGLSAGTYTVTVTDANGCVKTASVTITQPTVLVAEITSSTNASCNGCSDGSATASATGGIPPYTYSWNTTPAQTTQTATGLSADDYIVTVTDANGCIDTASVIITEPAVNVVELAEEFGIKIYPNPTKDIIVVQSSKFKVQGYELRIYDLLGKEVEMLHYAQHDKGQIVLDISTLPQGVYFVKVSDSRNVVVKKLVKM